MSCFDSCGQTYLDYRQRLRRSYYAYAKAFDGRKHLPTPEQIEQAVPVFSKPLGLLDDLHMQALGLGVQDGRDYKNLVEILNYCPDYRQVSTQELRRAEFRWTVTMIWKAVKEKMFRAAP